MSSYFYAETITLEEHMARESKVMHRVKEFYFSFFRLSIKILNS